MNLDNIKEEVKKKEGEILHFKFNGSRNQIEEFDGEIVKAYPSIFLIRLKGKDNQVKSFTYSDLVTESLEILS